MWIGDREVDGRPYLNCLPWEAAELSRTGLAFGYDSVFYGEKTTNATLIAKVDKGRVVKIHRLLQWEKDQMYDPYGRKVSTEEFKKLKRMRAIILRGNTYEWDNLTWYQRNYLLSLDWVPERPVSPLEALAVQAGDLSDA